MAPVLFSFSFFHLYSISVCIVLAWLVFSFLFWRHLRANGISEDKIFDLTFFGTIWAFIFSRILFVLLHPELFSDSYLKIAAIWIVPGFTLYGAMFGAFLAFAAMSKRLKVRLGLILDAFAMAFPVPVIIGLLGVFLDGSAPGDVTGLPWALPVAGLKQLRHPVQLYEILVMGILIFYLWKLYTRSTEQRKPYGVIGICFFLVYSIPMFLLEFLKDTRVYWISLSANQWILIAIFAEALGAFYVRCGGREAVRPIGNKIRHSVRNIFGGAYEKIIRRSDRKPEEKA